MMVLLRKSDTRQNVKCAICGQYFRAYWEPKSAAERIAIRAIISGGLKRHHKSDPTPDAHPSGAFNLSSWGREMEFAGTSLVGSLPATRSAQSLDRNGTNNG